MRIFTIDIVMRPNKQLLLIVIVPVLFASGIMAFFVLVPAD